MQSRFVGQPLQLGHHRAEGRLWEVPHDQSQRRASEPNDTHLARGQCKNVLQKITCLELWTNGRTQKISEKGLSMQLNKILDRAETDMWGQIRTVFETAVDSAQEKLESYLKGRQSNASMTHSALLTSRQTSNPALKRSRPRKFNCAMPQLRWSTRLCARRLATSSGTWNASSTTSSSSTLKACLACGSQATTLSRSTSMRSAM